MKYADLTYIQKSNRFNGFASEHNFQPFSYKNKIYLFSKCLTLEIYAFTVEKIVYINFFNNDSNLTVDVDTLLYEKDSAKIKEIAEKFSHKPLSLNIDETEPEKSMRILRENYLYTYIILMESLLSDFLNCKNTLENETLFEDTFYKNKERVEEAKTEYLKTRNSRFLLDDEIL